ncbi:MAG TPA: hypothetical protein VG843_05505 [Rhizomicrobium sp.]|jgi:hypothetical protein|nr:hypothetical protein [Rhizomicrobium sp.]
MGESAILNWHDYFVTVAQVSATLAGLLFVGVTISLNHMLEGLGYLYRAWAALFLQFEALLVGLFALVPGQPPQLLGVEFIAAGLAVLAAIRVFGHYFPEDERSQVLGSKGARAIREALIHVATLLPVVAGCLVMARASGALYWLIPSEIISLYLSFGLAWVFAIEIPRRKAAETTAKP